MVKVTIMSCDRCSKRIEDYEPISVQVIDRNTRMILLGEWCKNCVDDIGHFFPVTRKLSGKSK